MVFQKRALIRLSLETQNVQFLGRLDLFRLKMPHGSARMHPYIGDAEAGDWEFVLKSIRNACELTFDADDETSYYKKQAQKNTLKQPPKMLFPAKKGR